MFRTMLPILQLAPFDPTKKKKKKKVVIQEPSDEVDKLAEKTESLAGVLSIYKKEIQVHWIIFFNGAYLFLQSPSQVSRALQA